MRPSLALLMNWLRETLSFVKNTLQNYIYLLQITDGVLGYEYIFGPSWTLFNLHENTKTYCEKILQLHFLVS